MLLLNSTPYTRDDLIDLPVDELQGISPYESYTLRFCQQWLQGQSHFSIKTSGSTGEPKTVVLKRSQMIASAHLTGRSLRLQSGDSALVCLSTEHIAGMMMLVRGLELGLLLTVITPTRNPLTCFADNTKFTFTSMVPLQLQEIFNRTPDKISLLNNMQTILVGGAPISEDLLAQIRNLTCTVYHTYGMTETVSHIAFKPLNGHYASHYFIPLQEVDLGVCDRGCLTITSPLTDNKPLLTNDLVELRKDGSFSWLGRIDNVINTGGFKVLAEKVETVIEKIFQREPTPILANRRFFIGSLNNSDYGNIVVAVIEGSSISEGLQRYIKSVLKSVLKPYEIPKTFRFLPHFLETPTGKVDRQANLALLHFTDS